MEIQGYNMPSFETLTFDLSELDDIKRNNALICLYRAIQWRTGYRAGDDHLMYIERREGKTRRDEYDFVDKMKKDEAKKY